MRNSFLAFCCIVVLMTFPAMASAAPHGGLLVSFIDVGQGDSVLLHAPGQCAMLVDTGTAAAGRLVVSELRAQGITTLDRVVVTHPHQDHFGGLVHIAEHFDIGALLDNGEVKSTEYGFTAYAALRQRLNSSAVAAGHRWSCGGLNVEVLHPSVGYAGGNTNDRSLVLEVRYHDFRLLLMGDVAGQGEVELVGTGTVSQAAVLKLGHHGAPDSTSDALLDQVRPQLAVLSVGPENDIMAPGPHVLERLARRGVRLLRTDRQGTIHLVANRDGTFLIHP